MLLGMMKHEKSLELAKSAKANLQFFVIVQYLKISTICRNWIISRCQYTVSVIYSDISI